jgi:hypothetical protein
MQNQKTKDRELPHTPIKGSNKIITNANDGNYPLMEYTSLERKFSSLIVYYLNIFVFGNSDVIQHTGKVDLDFYCKMHRWTVKIAVALSMGQSPGRIEKYRYAYSREFRAEYKKRVHRLTQSIKHNFIPYEQERHWYFPYSYPSIKPIHFLKWAKKEDWELYFDMDESIKKHHVDEDIDFRIRCKELELENRELREQVNVGARENKDDGYINPKRHSSYKKLIAGLLRLAFPNVNEINAHNVANKLSNISFLFPMLDEETIRDVIKEPREMLNIRPPSRTNNVSKK